MRKGKAMRTIFVMLSTTFLLLDLALPASAQEVASGQARAAAVASATAGKISFWG